MSGNRSFLWQDITVILDDQNSTTNAYEYRTPPEHYLRCNGARFLRVAWEATAVQFGAAFDVDLEFETSDSPEPFAIIGSTSTDRTTWATLTNPSARALARGKLSGRATFAIDSSTAETAGGAALHEYVRIHLLNTSLGAGDADSVRLRVWVTLTD